MTDLRDAAGGPSSSASGSSNKWDVTRANVRSAASLQADP